MFVLDLDLDFFLTDCCPLAVRYERPDASCASPWPKEDVEAFLERNLGLSKAHPVRGVITETHDGALQFWRDSMEAGILCKPFSVVHIDAHSDLGIGRPGPGFVLQNVLGIPPQIRDRFETYYAQKQLDESNYLLFALAFRWVDSLTVVRDPFSRNDFPYFIRKEGEKYLPIRLESFVSRLFEDRYGAEPTIPFSVCSDPWSFSVKEPFTCMNLACSPRYTPKAADELIPLIAEYMDLVSYKET